MLRSRIGVEAVHRAVPVPGSVGGVVHEEVAKSEGSARCEEDVSRSGVSQADRRARAMSDSASVELPGRGHTVLIIVPHADDAALFCGGTLRLMADRGARLVMLRVTDDRYDSVGMSIADTIATNTAEMRRAADILGIDEIIELGWETDRLGDASEVALRERFIYHVRRVRPYAVMSFDP